MAQDMHQQQAVQLAPPGVPSNAPSVLVITTGATMFLAASQDGTHMQALVKPQDLLAPLCPKVPCKATLLALPVRSGAELSCATLFQIRDLVIKLLSQHAGAVLLTGTDTMDEAAFMLHLLLGPFCTELGKPLVITGAMKPSDVEGADGSSNALDALRLATHAGSRRLGVVVAINDCIHLARYVSKGDSQLMGSFCSHPGPIGQLRNGRCLLYYLPPPLPPIGILPAPATAPASSQAAATPGAPGHATDAPTAGSTGPTHDAAAAGSPAGSSAGTGAADSGAAAASDSANDGCELLQLPSTSEEARAFLQLPFERLKERVAIWTVTVSAFLPEVLLGELDGLVLAAPGTGSLPARLVEQLSPTWTQKLPIVISSRCATGNNFDDHLYKGSRAHYEDRGFLLSTYQHLTPLQARLLLMLRLSTAAK